MLDHFFLPLTVASAGSPLSALGATLGTLLTIVTVTALVVLIRLPNGYVRPKAPWWRQVALGAACGATAGGAVLLVTGHHLVPHTDSPAWVFPSAVMTLCVGLGLMGANLHRTPARRKLVALTSAVVLVLAASVAVNIDRTNGPTHINESAAPTTRAAMTSTTPPIVSPVPDSRESSATTVAPTPNPAMPGFAVATSLYRTWRAPAGMPSQGRLESESIPGEKSHFVARRAEVYLPPAALVAHAPALPVLILLSGQPASPLFVVNVGHAVSTLNALASRNRGLAPILVVPDQLGQPQINPMCVDSPLGNAATYIMTDVPNWIDAHLNAIHNRDGWAIGGFSEGGTCSIQFAAAHPDVFGSFIDVSGEKYPTLTSDADAIREGFSDNAGLYEKAKPETVMRDHGSYTDTVAVFAVGARDKRYGPIMTRMSNAAASHGIHVARFISPGTGHDWTTASNGFASGIGMLYQRFGLAQTGQYLAPYAPSS